jgi:protein gp37
VAGERLDGRVGRERALSGSGRPAPHRAAQVRFLSLEPLLGPLPHLPLDGVHWVIVGGESGPVRRRTDPAWVRDIRDQCRAAGVAFFFKQWGGQTAKAGGRALDGRTWDEMPAPEDRS